MFRKLHSNRDPKDTLLSELRKEFLPYIGKASSIITQKMRKHPILIFRVMIISILVSAGISFTLSRNSEPVERNKRSQINIVNDGFDQIRTTAKAINETIRLKQQIDSLSAKRNLSKQDSQTLENDLDQLRQLNQIQRP